MNPNDNKNNRKNNKPGGNWRGVASLVGWALLLTIIFSYASSVMGSTGRQASSINIEYGDFLEMVESGQVDRVEFDNAENILIITPETGYTYTGEDGTVYTKTRDGYTYRDAAGQEQTAHLELFTVQIQSNDAVVALLQEYGVEGVDKEYQAPVNPVLGMLVSYVLPFVFIFLAFSLIMRWMAKKGGMGGMGGIGGVGKANAKVYMEKSTGVTFKDVAGQDEAKESLTEIIDFLHNPQKYTEIGAKLPKGALLVGPPGTGKTLLAKAVAGEANVPFFSISGSDFVEMFVGVGASRVRDLFKEASKVAPCIVFIDEIDTIGKSRDNRMGGNDEREQTLNQLLAEMDGFDPTKGVILLAATNRPEVLDQALLRPGRFDRRITIDRPNLAGRIATLQVHTRNIKLAEDVNLKKVALATAGCVGADLANLVNEAALRAVRKGRKLVTQEDLLAAFELVIAGTEKKGSVLTEFEKKLVAYHEVGHAMVAYKQKNTEPVQKITIVPHTQGSLGYTLLMPEEDKTELRTKDELMAKIMVSMGGRAAEEVVLNTMTNGASQDIQDATNVARNMVAMFGMSDEFGMMALASRRNQYLDGGYGMDCAQDTAARMDQAVKEILDRCYQQAVEVIKASREDMDKVVAYLLEKETITGGEMVAIIEGRDPELVENPYASTQAQDGFRPSSPEIIEPAAKKVHMISQKIEAPEDSPAQPEQAPQAPEDGTSAPPAEDTPPADAPEAKKDGPQ
ncbi:ATP-dependent zinc metalloprotease FtsH [Oscillibacter valericigenes]|uniref:ATP-dependent zinc metalloprotease FtsH n=1 Tax=Oscillibacter valericigenes TaxID=351091 RepID=UPI0019567748|nr:ATP-dependent zinc metalloprotease FtsH [Oscillibacter valericigenes]MBM6910591.1 ATP-dependent metallopeptidase FtsH/Yme1/Tma family protein [Oscillibacter valericigenes]HJB76546.1 ATP-dependent zinc metalloprotease FtsH [Candidatus Oscillibacter avistercoris]